MKELLLGLITLSTLSSFAADDFSFYCQRADGGSSPLIRFSSHLKDRLILNDGSAVGWGDEAINIYPEFKNNQFIIKGLVSGTVSLDVEDGSRQNVEFLFNLVSYNNFLRSWLTENSDLLAGLGTRYIYKRSLFVCKLHKY